MSVEEVITFYCFVHLILKIDFCPIGKGSALVQTLSSRHSGPVNHEMLPAAAIENSQISAINFESCLGQCCQIPILGRHYNTRTACPDPTLAPL